MRIQCCDGDGSQTEKFHSGSYESDESEVVERLFSLKILEMKGKLEMGRRLLKLFGSEPGFLSIGEITAVLRSSGTIPEERDE